MQSAEQFLVLGERARLGELLQGVAEAVVGLLDPALLVQRHAIVVQLVQQGEPEGGRGVITMAWPYWYCRGQWRDSVEAGEYSPTFLSAWRRACQNWEARWRALGKWLLMQRLSRQEVSISHNPRTLRM